MGGSLNNRVQVMKIFNTSQIKIQMYRIRQKWMGKVLKSINIINRKALLFRRLAEKEGEGGDWENRTPDLVTLIINMLRPVDFLYPPNKPFTGGFFNLKELV
jgi:hypothetical protein